MPVLFYPSLLIYLECDDLSPGTSLALLCFVHCSPGMHLYYTYRVFWFFSFRPSLCFSFQSCAEALLMVFSLWSKLGLYKTVQPFHHQKSKVFIQIIKAIKILIPVEVFSFATWTQICAPFVHWNLPKPCINYLSPERGKFHFSALHSFNNLHKWNF